LKYEYGIEETRNYFQKLGTNHSFSWRILIPFGIVSPDMETMILECDFLPKQCDSIRLCLALLCIVALILVPLQLATAFELKVGLYDGKRDSGKVKVSVSSLTTHKEKSSILDVGKITAKSGDSRIGNIIFKFSDKELPPNGSFSACVYSNTFHKNECEFADRHYNANSAGIWIQVPSSNHN